MKKTLAALVLAVYAAFAGTGTIQEQSNHDENDLTKNRKYYFQQVRTLPKREIFIGRMRGYSTIDDHIISVLVGSDTDFDARIDLWELYYTKGSPSDPLKGLTSLALLSEIESFPYWFAFDKNKDQIFDKEEMFRISPRFDRNAIWNAKSYIERNQKILEKERAKPEWKKQGYKDAAQMQMHKIEAYKLFAIDIDGDGTKELVEYHVYPRPYPEPIWNNEIPNWKKIDIRKKVNYIRVWEPLDNLGNWREPIMKVRKSVNNKQYTLRFSTLWLDYPCTSYAAGYVNEDKILDLVFSNKEYGKVLMFNKDNSQFDIKHIVNQE